MEYLTTEAERRYQKKNYQRNRDKKLEYARQYREENKESIREYQERYSMTHDRSDYYRQYYAKNKEVYHQRYLRKKAEKRNQELQEMFGGE